jgi:hypothetical protein
MGGRSRRRVLLRTFGSEEWPGERAWCEREILSGVGATRELARAEYDRELARLAHDGLEVAHPSPLPPPVLDELPRGEIRCWRPEPVTLRVRPGFVPPPTPPDAWVWRGTARPKRSKSRAKPKTWKW